MRRLAKQSRKDTYKSNRDYQTLHDRRGQRFVPVERSPFRIVFEAMIEHDSIGLVCWGGYALARSPITLTATLVIQGRAHPCQIKIDRGWRRMGAIVTGESQAGKVKLSFEWNRGTTPIDIWGLRVGRPEIPADNADKNDLTVLKQTHLIPETFYLAHETALNVDIAADESKPFRIQEGSPIKVKKCSYCGRLLPVDPARLGALAFHKHNAKLTKHQNECRACKKWRINDSFNPLRTTDQLHESSVITRERKLFLREPEILQEIKDRTGAGLKSKVWNRFGRRCFRCGTSVALNDYQLDHTRPLAYLWPIDEFATCLCAQCNNEKKEKFPVDFYTPQQLKRLSEITGLPLVELKKKHLNERELNRILDDLPTFARDWEPRTFLATTRKIKELRSDIDLLTSLKAINLKEFQRMVQELSERPPPLDEE